MLCDKVGLYAVDEMDLGIKIAHNIIAKSFCMDGTFVMNRNVCYAFQKVIAIVMAQISTCLIAKRPHYHTHTISRFIVHKFLHSIADKTIADKRYLEKPYVMTEFSHAMGMGPGGLGHYVDLILANKNFLGGFIWEYCDHIVDNPNHKFRFTYGGDYNEPKHDGNFCGTLTYRVA